MSGSSATTKLGRWKAEIDRLLTNNVESAARERLTLIRVFEELRALGYEGGYDAVRRYARSWSRAHAGQTGGRYVPRRSHRARPTSSTGATEIVVLSA